MRTTWIFTSSVLLCSALVLGCDADVPEGKSRCNTDAECVNADPELKVCRFADAHPEEKRCYVGGMPSKLDGGVDASTRSKRSGVEGKGGAGGESSADAANSGAGEKAAAAEGGKGGSAAPQNKPSAGSGGAAGAARGTGGAGAAASSDMDEPDAGPACPGGRACDDGTCPRLRWGFEADDPDPTVGLSFLPAAAAKSKVTPSNFAWAGKSVLSADLNVAASDTGAEIRLNIQLCRDRSLIDLSGLKPHALYLFQNELPKGTQSIVSVFGEYGRDLKKESTDDAPINTWLLVEPADKEYEAEVARIHTVQLWLKLPPGKGFTGAALVDEIILDCKVKTPGECE